MYKEQFDELKENFDKGKLYYEKKNKEYLHKILNHIIKYNPELNYYRLQADSSLIFCPICLRLHKHNSDRVFRIILRLFFCGLTPNQEIYS